MYKLGPIADELFMAAHRCASFSVLNLRPERSLHASVLFAFPIDIRPPAARKLVPKPPFPPLILAHTSIVQNEASEQTSPTNVEGPRRPDVVRR